MQQNLLKRDEMCDNNLNIKCIYCMLTEIAF